MKSDKQQIRKESENAIKWIEALLSGNYKQNID